MLVMTIWTVTMNQFGFGAAHNLLLQVINFIILVIAVWIAFEGIIKFFAPRDMTETSSAVAMWCHEFDG